MAAASGFNEKGVGQLAEMVHQRVDEFLLALGFDQRFVVARELISAEVARALRSTDYVRRQGWLAEPSGAGVINAR